MVLPDVWPAAGHRGAKNVTHIASVQLPTAHETGRGASGRSRLPKIMQTVGGKNEIRIKRGCAPQRPALALHAVRLHASQQVADSSSGGSCTSCSRRHSERTAMRDGGTMPHAAGTLELLAHEGPCGVHLTVLLGPRGPRMNQLSSQRLDCRRKLVPSLTLPGRGRRPGWVRPAFCGSRAGWERPTGKEERSQSCISKEAGRSAPEPSPPPPPSRRCYLPSAGCRRGSAEH